MHPLLERHLKQLVPLEPPDAEAWRLFLKAIDGVFTQNDADRLLLERSLEQVTPALHPLSAEDAAHRGRMEDALTREREELIRIVERLPFTVGIRRGEKLVYINGAGARGLGYTPQELIGRSVLRAIHQEDRARARQLIVDDPEQPQREPAELRFVRRDGQVILLEVLPVRTITFDGESAVLMVGSDITERRKLQARLMLSDRMASVGTLAAGVGHEINNPLAFVVSNLQYVLQDLMKPGSEPTPRLVDEWREALTEALEGAQRVRQIVRDLKAFSRADDVRTGPVPLEPVIESAIKFAWNEIRHRAQLVRQFVEVPPVQGNTARLGQVFVNLLVNAAQAMPDGAADRNQIHVRIASAGPSRVAVEVEDSGPGIPPEIRGRIFDPFFTTKPVGVGTGLGLSICHSIVTALGGEIELSCPPDGGSVFRVLLPVAPARAVAAIAPTPPPLPAVPTPERRRMLLIDDEPMVGKSLERILADDHVVDVVTSARQALSKLISGQRYDVILCDLMMPEMTGIDLHAELEQRYPPLAARMVFMTGGAFTARAQKFLEEIPNRWLEKPFDAAQLLAVLREVT